MKLFLKYFFLNVFISFFFVSILYFILKNFDIKENTLILILIFSYLLILIFSFANSIFIYKLKNKINYLELQINKLNKYDEITDIYKREFLLETLKKYYEISSKKKYPLSIMILDIDNFQNINKIYGFDTGNKILKQIAYILKKNSYSIDMIGKYDSDEFLIATFCDKNEMECFAKKIKKTINDFDFEKNISLNVSIGITEKQNIDTFSDFLTRAQEAVILAKKKGGNTVDILEHFLLIQ